MEVAKAVADFALGIADGVVRRGNVMALHEFFGEALARFQARGFLRGAEDAPAAPSEFVHDTERQGELRAHDSEVGLEFVGDGNDGINAFDVDRDALSLLADAAIPGGAVNLRDSARLPQLPYQCVLASATADDEDFHSRQVQKTQQSRGG